MRSGWWLGLALLLLAPAGADPGGKIPPAPAQGEPLPADVQVELTLNGQQHVWSGAQLRATHGEVRVDQTILLGILQGLVEKEDRTRAPEFTPVLNFKRVGVATGPTDRGGPPEDAVKPPSKPSKPRPAKGRIALKPPQPRPAQSGVRVPSFGSR